MNTKSLKEHEQLEGFILSTISYFDPMTFSQIILDFDNKKLSEFPNFNKEELHEILKKLEKKKLLKKIVTKEEASWIRVYPKRSWWRKIFT